MLFTAGLPTLASLWISLIADGGADVCMASTAYGGSSQLSDLLCLRSANLRKHTFDVQGTAAVSDSVERLLTSLATERSTLMPTTVIFLKAPTNPDMKVPDLNVITRALREYKISTGRKVVLLLDSCLYTCLYACP